MNLRCWVGAIARINASAFPENVGRLVEVLAFAEPDEYGPSWIVKSASGPLTAVLSGTHYVIEAMGGHIHDRFLTPITPRPGEGTTDTDATEGIGQEVTA